MRIELADKKFLKKFKKVVDILFYIMYIKQVADRQRQTHGIIAQLGEHLPYKQGVTGSSPVGPTYEKS